jgi:glycosyltransferase involved in cell wall biosynthesis
MQKTNFRYEIIIGEDYSSDNTRQIISEYCQRYPDLIQMVISDSNVGIVRNYNRILEKARGKYIAICDGDDYWIDPLKLQKQVDFLEANNDFVICCHYSYLVNEAGVINYADDDPKPFTYSFHDILLGKKKETRNSTLLIRNSDEFIKLTSEEWFLKCYAQDRFLKLYATASTGKKIHVIPEIMGCYRVHPAGIWSMAGSKIVGPKTRSDFNLTINNFKYPDEQRKQLLHKYLKRYLLYDLKKFRFYQAYSTLRTLV